MADDGLGRSYVPNVKRSYDDNCNSSNSNVPKRRKTNCNTSCASTSSNNSLLKKFKGTVGYLVPSFFRKSHETPITTSTSILVHDRRSVSVETETTRADRHVCDVVASTSTNVFTVPTVTVSSTSTAQVIPPAPTQSHTVNFPAQAAFPSDPLETASTVSGYSMSTSGVSSLRSCSERRSFRQRTHNNQPGGVFGSMKVRNAVPRSLCNEPTLEGNTRHLSVHGTLQRRSSVAGDIGIHTPFYPGRPTFGGAANYNAPNVPYRGTISAVPVSLSVNYTDRSNSSERRCQVASATAQRILNTLDRLQLPSEDTRDSTVTTASESFAPRNISIDPYRSALIQRGKVKSMSKPPPTIPGNSLSRNVKSVGGGKQVNSRIFVSREDRELDSSHLGTIFGGQLNTSNVLRASVTSASALPSLLPTSSVSGVVPQIKLDLPMFSVASGKPTSHSSTTAGPQMVNTPLNKRSIAGSVATSQSSNFVFSRPIDSDRFPSCSAVSDTVYDFARPIDIRGGDGRGATVTAVSLPSGVTAAQFQPKRKAPVAPTEVVPKPPPLHSGSVMDFLSSGNRAPVSAAASTAGRSVTEPTSVAAPLAQPQSQKQQQWQCDSCLVFNRPAADRCIACNTVRPTMAATAAGAAIAASTTATATSTAGGVAAKWRCDVCAVENAATVAACACCETPQPSSPAATAARVASATATSTSATAEKWRCDVCVVENAATVAACVCCETPRPGPMAAAATPATESATPKLTFMPPALPANNNYSALAGFLGNAAKPAVTSAVAAGRTSTPLFGNPAPVAATSAPAEMMFGNIGAATSVASSNVIGTTPQASGAAALFGVLNNNRRGSGMGNSQTAAVSGSGNVLFAFGNSSNAPASSGRLLFSGTGQPNGAAVTTAKRANTVSSSADTDSDDSAPFEGLKVNTALLRTGEPTAPLSSASSASAAPPLTFNFGVPKTQQSPLLFPGSAGATSSSSSTTPLPNLLNSNAIAGLSSSSSGLANNSYRPVGDTFGNSLSATSQPSIIATTTAAATNEPLRFNFAKTTGTNNNGPAMFSGLPVGPVSKTVFTAAVTPATASAIGQSAPTFNFTFGAKPAPVSGVVPSLPINGGGNGSGVTASTGNNGFSFRSTIGKDSVEQASTAGTPLFSATAPGSTSGSAAAGNLFHFGAATAATPSGGISSGGLFQFGGASQLQASAGQNSLFGGSKLTVGNDTSSGKPNSMNLFSNSNPIQTNPPALFGMNSNNPNASEAQQPPSQSSAAAPVNMFSPANSGGGGGPIRDNSRRMLKARRRGPLL